MFKKILQKSRNSIKTPNLFWERIANFVVIVLKLFMSVSPSLLIFLNELKQFNSREWFAENKARYASEKAIFDALIEELIQQFSAFENMDGVEKKHCSYRIFRDVRFSKNKDPYKTWFSASFSEGGRKSGYMDYYLHIEPGNKSFLGGGMYNPTPEQLAAYRQEVDYNGANLRGIVESPIFIQYFGNAEGESLKKVPKGFDPSPADEVYLRRKQLFYWHHFTDKELVSPEFISNLMRCAEQLKPFLDFLNATFFDKEPFLKD
jgi:uncharacterized protein (TIGR02453 family)